MLEEVLEEVLEQVLEDIVGGGNRGGARGGVGGGPGIPDLKNVVPGAIIMPALQPQEAQCHQTLRLCIRESAGRAVSVATAEPRTQVKVRLNVRPNVTLKVRPKVKPKVGPSHVKSSQLLFRFSDFRFSDFSCVLVR